MKTRRIYPRIEPESFEAQCAAHRYNPANVARYARQTFTLEAGDSDQTDFWSSGDRFYCLSRNYGLGYVGLQAFDVSDGSEAGSAFMQNASEELQEDWDDLAPATLFRLLLEYV